MSSVIWPEQEPKDKSEGKAQSDADQIRSHGFCKKSEISERRRKGLCDVWPEHRSDDRSPIIIAGLFLARPIVATIAERIIIVMSTASFEIISLMSWYSSSLLIRLKISFSVFFSFSFSGSFSSSSIVLGIEA